MARNSTKPKSDENVTGLLPRLPRRFRMVALLGVVALISCGYGTPLQAVGPRMMNTLVTDWTESYKHYPYPHAVWLTAYDKVGANLGKLYRVLNHAETKKQSPEVVIYTVPFRDIGQSSQGGFDTIEEYIADNELIAEHIATFVTKTGIQPRVYLEPDALGHAIQYRRDHNDNPKSMTIYRERVESSPRIIQAYKRAGAKVYLDAAHSGWFDYNDNDIRSMALTLNAAGIKYADGLTFNVSNRQKVREGERPNTEWHYISRLLPHLENKNLDIVVDTSRNGGTTHARRYYLRPDGMLIDNETVQGRVVGAWRKDSTGEIWVHPFFGEPLSVTILTTKDKYTFNRGSMILNAPPWLDAVGDVQVGHAPSDNPGVPLIHRFRHIKPPDDCDGSLNCPPGESKSLIWQQTAKLQQNLGHNPTLWNTLK